MVNFLSWLNLLLIIIIIIVLIIFIIFFAAQFDNLTQFGLAFNLRNGTKTDSTDTLNLRGNTMYIGQSSSPLILSLNRSETQSSGQFVGIKNNSGNNITLQAGTIKLDLGQLNNTITTGQTSWLIATDNNNSWLRLT